MIFKGPDDQRAHYKTDLHRFNLKRKVAGLPPVTQEMLDKKVQDLKAEETEKDKKLTFSCTLCKKNYSSEKALKGHLNSNKHKEREITTKKLDRDMNINIKRQEKDQQTPQPTTNQTQTETPTPTPPVEEEKELTEDEWIAQKVALAHKFEETECLFCHLKSSDLTSNAKHMASEHGLFIPDIEYLVDLKGLILYLGEKIAIGNICLFCNGKGRAFDSLQAVQSHMMSLSHCKIAYDEIAADEYGDFYDFSSTYSDLDPNLTPEELQQIVRSKSIIQLTEDGLHLTLSSGRVVGHRGLSLYYAQHYKPTDTRDSVVARVGERYKLIGDTGTVYYSPRSMDHDRKSEFYQKKNWVDVGIRNNFHYVRPQVLF